ncbi:MAG: hypothetical protein IKF78_04550 [Atopobiaceae bacterium]|nr:hypothetical protein [Atopobiaceae bacterium]
MLKYRIIGAFVAVWCAVCVSYVGVRMALGALTGKADVPTESVEASSSSVASNDGSSASSDKAAAEDSTPPVEDSAETSAQDPTESSAEAQAQDPAFADSQTQSEEILSAPSLSEYLSQYTCGSCRRNCSLDNPRCHNGSRLAELKAQEYYETYG